MKLGVHSQGHFRGRCQEGVDVGLENVFLGIDVRVEIGEIRLLEDSVLIVGSHIHEVIHLLASTCHVDVEVLVESPVLEQKIVPVHVRIGVRIHMVHGVRDFLLGVVGILSSGLKSLVECVHEGDGIGSFRNFGGLGGTGLDPYIDGHPLGVASALCRDDHDSVGSP